MASFANVSRNPEADASRGIAADFLGFATLFRGIQLLARTISDRNAERRERQQIARELSSYTDRELHELGFSRGDVPMIAAGTYRR